MSQFRVNVQRTQVQTQTFVVKCDNQSDLEKKLKEFDFGQLDVRFDEGEVDSICYEVTKVEPCTSVFIDDLQEYLDN
jgi:hypothetical protein